MLQKRLSPLIKKSGYRSLIYTERYMSKYECWHF